MMPVFLALACAAPHLDALECACDAATAHGARRCEGGACGPCLCLPLMAVAPDPPYDATFSVGPRDRLDWPAIDAALRAGSVRIDFGPGTYPERLDVLRTDLGPHRLLLDGGHHAAVVPGILTPYDDIRRSRITVRGFEVTGSRDKGIYWRAGDEVILEDNVVHDNRGTPAINLEYANRTGLPSTSFVVRNNHVFNQPGECIYIGGSEGEDVDAHASVEIVNNLVHNCWNGWDSKHDAINVKDRIGRVTVARNVVFETHWGIEVASPGWIANNLVFDTQSNGLHLNDQWGTGLSGLTVVDTVVLRAGEHGARVGADRLGAEGIVFSGFTVQGSAEGGAVWAGESGVSASLDRIVLADNEVGLDGWGTVTLDVAACQVHGNELDDDRSADGAASGCDHERPGFGDLENPAGPDQTFFTDDDPWLVAGGAALPVDP